MSERDESTESWIPRRLLPADITDCFALSSEAGWNQTESDWEFIILNSEAYGLASCSGQVVATTVAFTAPGTRWIAMVLVGKAWRGHGLASVLLEKLQAGQMSTCSDYLDATSLGAPIYLRLGFVTEGCVVRYEGKGLKGAISKSAEGNVYRIVDGESNHAQDLPGSIWCPEIMKYCQSSAPESCLTLNDDTGSGFIWARPGRLGWQVGPILATNVDVAAQLLSACLETLEGPVFIDVPGEMETFISLIEDNGFAETRKFERMFSGVQVVPRSSGMNRFATAGPDFG